MKEQAIKEKMRLKDLMAEASYMKQKKLKDLAMEKLEVKMEIVRGKSTVKIMEREEQKFGNMQIRKILVKNFMSNCNFLRKI